MAATAPSSALAARLSVVPHNQLAELTARLCHGSADALGLANAALSEHVPAWAVEDVLLSPDLLPRIFSTLELEDGVAAAVCSTWCQTWIQTDEQRRGLRLAELSPAPAGFNAASVFKMAAHPSGETMAITQQNSSNAIGILDPSFQQLRRIITPSYVVSMCFSEDRLFACTCGTLISYCLESSEEVARFNEEELDYTAYYGVVVGPNGLVYVNAFFDGDSEVLEQPVDLSEAIVALDAVTLEQRLHFGRGVFDGEVYGLAVVGDELYVGDRSGRSIRVFSLAGEHLREIKGDWREPSSLAYYHNRLYLTEKTGEGEEWRGADEGEDPDDEETWSEGKKSAGKRIFALTPEGETLQVWPTDRPVANLVVFGRKLIAQVGVFGARELIALKGI